MINLANLLTQISFNHKAIKIKLNRNIVSLILETNPRLKIKNELCMKKINNIADVKLNRILYSFFLSILITQKALTSTSKER